MSAEILPEADCRRSPLKFLGLAVLLILTDVICISGEEGAQHFDLYDAAVLDESTP